MSFEWDEKKNEINIKKHGIDFADVCEMFGYPMLTCLDARKDYGEDRLIGIGTLKTTVAVVVFTERANNSIRIISARKADRNERKKYHETIKDRLEKA